MTDKARVIATANALGLALLKPTRKAPGIVAHDPIRLINGIAPCVVDARTWADAREQIESYATGVLFRTGRSA